MAVSIIFFLTFLVSVYSKPLWNDDFKWEARHGGFVFEGDMILSKETIEKALRGENIDGLNTHGYGLLKNTRARWPNGIVPYELAPSLKSKQRLIEAAQKMWENKTCIRFVKRTVERDYLYFFDGGFTGCASLIGRAHGKQRLSLGPGCYVKGIIAHELGHALGLYHEQSRPDRDDYVEILWDNIRSGVKHAFHKYPKNIGDSRNSPYDYDSLMHYGKKAFSKNGKDTIRAKTPGVSFGQRDHVSNQDAWQINKFYGCKN